ncbi:MAG TPA: hypothetical protein VEP71_02520, partial [Gallionella sp.]|nr:hypothetical protein [Gallionella sp.]
MSKGKKAMTLGDLSKQLISQGFHLIQVESLPEEECLSFIGTFDEYLAAAKALGARVIFVSISGISEDDFIYINPNHTYSHHAGPAASWPFPLPSHKSRIANTNGDVDIDLCLIDPNLSKFKERIGEDGRFDLLCTDGHYNLA